MARKRGQTVLGQAERLEALEIGKAVGKVGQLIAVQIEQRQVGQLPDAGRQARETISVDHQHRQLRELPDPFGQPGQPAIADRQFLELDTTPDALGELFDRPTKPEGAEFLQPAQARRKKPQIRAVDVEGLECCEPVNRCGKRGNLRSHESQGLERRDGEDLLRKLRQGVVVQMKAGQTLDREELSGKFAQVLRTEVELPAGARFFKQRIEVHEYISGGNWGWME